MYHKNSHSESICVEAFFLLYLVNYNQYYHATLKYIKCNVKKLIL